MGKQIKLTPQGHRVMGALATFIVPKLAADQSLQSVELEAVCKSIKPDRYDRQLNGILGTVKERFGSRLAQDESLDGLSKVLASLMPADLAMDKKKEEEAEDEDDSNDDANDAAEDEDETGEDSFADFMKTKKAKDSFADFIKSKKKAKDAKEEDDEDEDDDDESDEDEDDERAKDKKAKDKKADNDADLDNKEDDMHVGDKRAKDAAMDAAMEAARTEGADLAMRRLNARYEAADLVKPIIGKVNPLAQDATSIYKMALDAKGADLTGVPRVAYKAVLQTLLKAESGKGKPKFAQDTAVTKNLQDEFPNAPGLA